MADEELPVIARFEVRRRSYLAPDGSVQRRLPSFVSDTNLLRSQEIGQRIDDVALDGALQVTRSIPLVGAFGQQELPGRRRYPKQELPPRSL